MAADTTVKVAKTPKTFTPNWDAMMKILGEPSQSAVYRNPNGQNFDEMDGAWDFKAAQQGVGMRRVAADIGKTNTEIETPCGFVFVCGNCGFARRVIDSEHSFTCERPNAAGEKGCGVIWQVELYESDDVDNKTGDFKKKPVHEERIAPKTNRKYMMPKIYGMLVADMRRETALARKAAGKPSASEMQPQTFGEQKKEQPQRAAEPIVVPELPEPTTGGVQ